VTQRVCICMDGSWLSTLSNIFIRLQNFGNSVDTQHYDFIYSENSMHTNRDNIEFVMNQNNVIVT